MLFYYIQYSFLMLDNCVTLRHKDEFLFKIIALFKRELISYGCLECYINFFIHNSLPAKKGLVELIENLFQPAKMCTKKEAIPSQKILGVTFQTPVNTK